MQICHRNVFQFLIILLICLTVASCGRQRRLSYPTTGHTPGIDRQPRKQLLEQPQVTTPPTRGPAYSLWEQAEQARKQGQYRQAEMILERALRIEPNNGWYWYSLALVELNAGKKQKARQFLLKAQSGAGNDQALYRKVEQTLIELNNL